MGAWPPTISRRSTAGRTRAPSDWPTSSSTGRPRPTTSSGTRSPGSSRSYDALVGSGRPTSERQSSTGAPGSGRIAASWPSPVARSTGPVEIPDPLLDVVDPPAARAARRTGSAVLGVAPGRRGRRRGRCRTGARRSTDRSRCSPALRPRDGLADADVRDQYQHQSLERDLADAFVIACPFGVAARPRVARPVSAPARQPAPSDAARRRGRDARGRSRGHVAASRARRSSRQPACRGSPRRCARSPRPTWSGTRRRSSSVRSIRGRSGRGRAATSRS